MKRFIQNEDGNFGIVFVLAAGIVMTTLGMAVDINRMHTTNRDLQSIVDGAALAGALKAEMSDAERIAAVEQAILENAGERYPDILNGVEIIFDDQADTISVRVMHEEDFIFGAFLNPERAEVSPIATVSYATEDLVPLTIVFALDTSGSMSSTAGSGQVKMDVLKDATSILFEELEANTRNPALLDNSLRTGMSAYNTALVDTQPIDWGYDHLEAAVDALVANGGTNSTPALQHSYDRLLDDRAFRQAQSASFKLNDLREYVLFMTDGDNNQPVFDEDSQALCETMRGDGVEIYSVAFSAPDKGRLLLLDCASWNEDKADVRGDRGNDGNDNKCGNNGAQGKGKAIGHCKDRDMEEDKSDYYFDAENADDFRAAFARIGREISPSNIRLVGSQNRG